jgi:hypothetical protein
MEPPRGWRPPQGVRVPFLVPPRIRCARYQPDRPTPRPTGEQTSGLSTLPRWKRFMLMYVIPVCMAMVWQLAVIIGFLAVFLLGWILIRLLWP